MKFILPFMLMLSLITIAAEKQEKNFLEHFSFLKKVWPNDWVPAIYPYYKNAPKNIKCSKEEFLKVQDEIIGVYDHYKVKDSDLIKFSEADIKKARELTKLDFELSLVYRKLINKEDYSK